MNLKRNLLLIACILPCVISAQNVVTPKVTFSLPGGAITSLPFPPYGPIGIAVTANQLITTLNGCQTVDSVSATGTVTQPFITLPSPGPIKTGICESYVAISPGLGGFTAGDIFVTQGNLVYEYTPGGAYVKTFTVGPTVTFNGNNGAHTGISFDSVGTFNNQMIVTVFDDSLGTTSVYTVNAAGTANLLTTLPGENESPEVIPAGQLLVAAGAPSYNVIALNAQGVPVHYYSAGDAEAVRYIPTNPCTFAGASYFQAEYAANQIVGIAPADIAAAAGSALVPSECCHGTEIVPPSQSYPNGFFVINEPDSTYPIQTQEGNAVCVALPPPPAACVIPPSGTAIPGSAVSWNKFNVPSGTKPTVWIHAHIGTPSGIPTNTITTVQFTGVTFVLNGITYNLPNGEIIFDPAAPSTPSTTFDSTNGWITTVNPNHLSDEIFFDGNGIPVDANISGGGKATFNYTTSSSDKNLAFSWQWSAAVFTYWPGNSSADILAYHASNHAGTPENKQVQQSLIQGPRGGGGSNFTGSWSGTGNGSCPKP